jgi:hypothetical protein
VSRRNAQEISGDLSLSESDCDKMMGRYLVALRCSVYSALLNYPVGGGFPHNRTPTDFVNWPRRENITPKFQEANR